MILTVYQFHLDDPLMAFRRPFFSNFRLRLRALLRLLLWSTIWLTPLCAQSLTEAQVTDQEVKATLIFKFPAFVSWPKSMPKQGPLIFCILGEDPFGDLLEHYTDARINDRPVRITHAASLDQVGNCHMLFIADSGQQSLTDTLAHIKGKPILTFADQPGLAKQGVMINFVERDNSILFEINPRAAKKAGLKIGSQLLRLAIVVR